MRVKDLAGKDTRFTVILFWKTAVLDNALKVLLL